MKKVLVALVAMLVAVGFTSVVMAGTVEKAKGEVKTEEGTVKFKTEEKTTTQAGQTVTTEKGKLTTGKPGYKNVLYGKITQYSDKDGSVTILRYKDETLNPKTATTMNLKVAPNHADKMKFTTNQGKNVIFASDKVTVDELIKDGLISPEWKLMDAAAPASN